jgi:pimeloyl-ACP methyl ester carboxylesterase
VAIMTAENRRPLLASVSAPTLVIHGDEDPLVLLEGGKDTAEAIPGAELMIVKGMGHYPPHGGPWPEIVEAIIAHTKKIAGL